MGLGGNRINSKTAKAGNTYAKKFIEEVLEAHAYANHEQDKVKNNYVMKVCEEITGEFDYVEKRLKKPLYHQNIRVLERAYRILWKT